MSGSARVRVCFYAPLRDREVLDRVEFYRQDLHALEQAGFDVVIATRWAEIPRDVDVYFIWWWTWAWQPLLVARMARRPAIVTGVFDYRWPEPGIDYVNRPLWQRLPMRAALRAADANVFIAQCEIRQVTEHLPVTRPLCVPLGVDTTLYRPGDAPRQPFVLSIGWLSAENARRKCMFEVVRAAALVLADRPGLRFVIAGLQGTAFPELQALTAQLGIADRVEWPGAVTEAEKIRLLQTCAVYVQPSVYEGFGLAILEALSCGAPVVSSPVGAVPEVVGDAGILIDGRAPEQLAAAVRTLLDDPEDAADRGRRGRARAVASFTVERRQQAIAALVAELAQGRQAR
jgi:glycosyltransferase involved in cell wall biosynthesis